MPEATHHDEVNVRRLSKFMRQSEEALRGAVAELGDSAFKFRIRGDRTTGQVSLEFSSVPLPELKACIVDCRPFFLESDDRYLPDVVSALRSESVPGHTTALEDLRDVVKQYVRGGRLHGSLMYSGQIETDNGLGPGQLLGSDQVAMDYIYGVALHDDADRLARLEHVPDEGLLDNVLMQLALLLKVVRIVRNQIIISVGGGLVPALIPDVPGVEVLDDEILTALPALQKSTSEPSETGR